MEEPVWSIAVFAANEARRIEGCVRSVDANCAEHRAQINVLLNGTTDRTQEVLEGIGPRNASLRVYLSDVADKANAMNQFIYQIRSPGALCFFVDGYVSVGGDSLRRLHDALGGAPHAHAASGLPLRGRSAAAYRQELLRGGSLNGNLFAVRHDVLDRFVARGLRIPLHIYRGDALLGSMLAHDLDALGTGWDDGRVIGVEGAVYDFEPLSPWRWRDVRRQFRREVRQARGTLENEAVKALIYDGGYPALPSSADRMIHDHIERHGFRPRSARDRFFTRLALRELRRAREADPGRLGMRLVLETPPRAPRAT